MREAGLRLRRGGAQRAGWGLGGQRQPPGSTSLGSQGAGSATGSPAALQDHPAPHQGKPVPSPGPHSSHTRSFWRQKLTGPPGWMQTWRPPPCLSGAMGHLWASEYSGNTTLIFLQQLSPKTPQVPRPMLGQMSKEPRGCQDHREKLRLGWGEWSASRPGICPQSCLAGAPSSSAAGVPTHPFPPAEP